MHGKAGFVFICDTPQHLKHYPDQPLAVNDLLKLFFCQIPLVGAYRTQIGMGCNKGLLSNLTQLLEASVIQVGYVCNNSRLFHPLHCLPSKRRKSLIRPLPAAQLVGTIPHKRHHLHAVFCQIIYILKGACKCRPAFHSKYHRTFPISCNPFHILRPAYQLRQIFLLLKKIVQIFLVIPEIRHRCLISDIIRNKNRHRLTEPVKCCQFPQGKLRFLTQEV